MRVGLTGGIASGKSTVAEIFATLGVPVIDTDVIAREVVEPGRPALEEIRERFGERMIDTHGRLDRAAMRSAVFSDDEARRDLEAILHPRIGAETRRQAAAAGGEYQLIVVPLLADSALREFVDRVLVVDCDEQTQLERLLERDAESLAQARRILAAQAGRQERLDIADDVIVNSGTLEETRNQVRVLADRYSSLAALRSRRARSPGTP
ncbi:MAG: dephospho-CoA kinase [Woeseiaceae bacterium]|nr:dephospho-CoA kinase [Woeseiaceae bacterium]